MKTQFSKLKKQTQRGFTLVEIAIVLVIIGLLIGGILRGQELITSARVRNLIDLKTSVQTAHYGFLDRFRLQAGMLTPDQAAMVGANATPSWSGTSSNAIAWQDSPTFFNNLAVSGFISCQVCAIKQTTASYPTKENSPASSLGGILWALKGFGGGSSGGYFLANSTATHSSTEIGSLVLSLGAGYSPDIMAEVDRKIDDGAPSTGVFRASSMLVDGPTPTTSTELQKCYKTVNSKQIWDIEVGTNCSGVNLL